MILLSICSYRKAASSGVLGVHWELSHVRGHSPKCVLAKGQNPWQSSTHRFDKGLVGMEGEQWLEAVYIYRGNNAKQMGIRLNGSQCLKVVKLGSWRRREWLSELGPAHSPAPDFCSWVPHKMSPKPLTPTELLVEALTLDTRPVCGLLCT